MLPQMARPGLKPARKVSLSLPARQRLLLSRLLKSLKKMEGLRREDSRRKLLPNLRQSTLQLQRILLKTAQAALKLPQTVSLSLAAQQRPLLSRLRKSPKKVEGLRRVDSRSKLLPKLRQSALQLQRILLKRQTSARLPRHRRPLHPNLLRQGHRLLNHRGGFADAVGVATSRRPALIVTHPSPRPDSDIDAAIVTTKAAPT